MKIELVILPEAGPTPEAPQTFALALEQGGMAVPAEPLILQRGFSTPRHALAALLECLTFAPPDMTAMEEGLSAISGLMDRVTDIEGAITQLGERLNAAEDTVEALQGPAKPAGNRLLPPRPGATAAAVDAANRPPASSQPQPSIRRPRQTIVTAGHGAGGAIRGGTPLVITGGVGARGRLAPTGPGTEMQGDVDTEE